jgi:hypothetical protein
VEHGRRGPSAIRSEGRDGLGLFSGQQIERLGIAASREVMLDESMDHAGDLTEHPGDIVDDNTHCR